MITGKNGSGKNFPAQRHCQSYRKNSNDTYKDFEKYEKSIKYWENQLKNNPQNTLSIEKNLQYFKNQYELFFGEVTITF